MIADAQFIVPGVMLRRRAEPRIDPSRVVSEPAKSTRMHQSQAAGILMASNLKEIDHGK